MLSEISRDSKNSKNFRDTKFVTQKFIAFRFNVINIFKKIHDSIDLEVYSIHGVGQFHLNARKKTHGFLLNERSSRSKCLKK